MSGSNLGRILWITAGLLLVGLGIIGVVVPVMPSTVFFIGAAACFARSSPRLEQWVLNLPKIGPTVRDYRAGLGIRRNVKFFIMGMISTVVIINAWLVIPALEWKIACLALGLIGVLYIWYQVPTREIVLARQNQASSVENQTLELS